MKRMKARSARRTTVGDVLIIALFAALALITLYPMWHCIVGSLMTYTEYMQKSLLIWPDELTLESNQFVFDQGKIYDPMKTTALVTVIGTVVNLAMVTWMAYGLSKKFPGSTLFTYIVVFTMFLNPGLIANYMLFRNLHLLNDLKVYILPYLINTFYLIILRTNFASFPTELEEAARIDGASEFGTFFRIVLPLSKPILATIALFTAVDYWNIYQQSVYFITDSSKKTLQDYLYMLLSNNSNNNAGVGIGAGGVSAVFSETIKLANTVIAVLPILVVYPFLQKYFTNGIMIGALKG